jgi:hypothetical protein
MGVGCIRHTSAQMAQRVRLTKNNRGSTKNLVFGTHIIKRAKAAHAVEDVLAKYLVIPILGEPLSLFEGTGGRQFVAHPPSLVVKSKFMVTDFIFAAMDSSFIAPNSSSAAMDSSSIAPNSSSAAMDSSSTMNFNFTACSWWAISLQL